ncbi:MAG: precorrin-6y C5,15-methyltransferase (decarboxylating) subunit CbiE, partial [Anaerotignaceae bacterium]
MKKLKNIHIIGGGMGEASLLTSQAMEVFKNCEKVFAFDRMASLLEKYRQVEKCSYNQLVTLINNCDESEIGVVVSGDVGFFSIASTLNNALKEKFNVNFLCGISSLQYLCSKVKIPYENVNVVSVHGRSGSVLGSIAYNKYTFVLTGGENNASVILKFLSNKIPKIKVIAAQHLSSDGEKIEMGTVEELSQKEYS